MTAGQKFAFLILSVAILLLCYVTLLGAGWEALASGVIIGILILIGLCFALGRT